MQNISCLNPKTHVFIKLDLKALYIKKICSHLMISGHFLVGVTAYFLCVIKSTKIRVALLTASFHIYVQNRVNMG